MWPVPNDVYKFRDQPCPDCGAKMNAVAWAHDTDDAVLPQPGDFTVHVDCGAVLELDVDGRWRLAEQAKLILAAAADDVLRKALGEAGAFSMMWQARDG